MKSCADCSLVAMKLDAPVLSPSGRLEHPVETLAKFLCYQVVYKRTSSNFLKYISMSVMYTYVDMSVMYV